VKASWWLSDREDYDVQKVDTVKKNCLIVHIYYWVYSQQTLKMPWKGFG
jgi:hypothetical protein